MTITRRNVRVQSDEEEVEKQDKSPPKEWRYEEKQDKYKKEGRERIVDKCRSKQL